uniref:Putative secreted protein n=1 Tax=Anopheles triannulatus TaxID=58253 RepID=A0A2M4B7D1_9DIPT
MLQFSDLARCASLPSGVAVVGLFLLRLTSASFSMPLITPPCCCSRSNSSFIKNFTLISFALPAQMPHSIELTA